LVYKKLKAKTDKKTIIKEIKKGLDVACQSGAASSAKAYVESVSSCLSQGFLPLPINALRYHNDMGFQELLIVSFSNKKVNEDKFEFQFDDHKTFRQPALRALEAVNKLLNAEHKKIFESLKLIVRLGDYPGGYTDKGHDGTTDSIGLALAIAIYFNFQLYLEKNNKKKLKQLRTVFEQELENIAFTGEITNEGKIKPISGIEQKVKAAENMGMKRIFCPVENKKNTVSESLSVIPVSNLEQANTLVRYGQYLEKIRDDKTKLPEFLIEERGFAKSEERPNFFNSFSGVETDSIPVYPQGEHSFKTFIRQPDVLSMLHKGVLVTGDGGIGKTTFLRYLRRYYSANILDGRCIEKFKEGIKIPVLLNLNGFKPDLTVFIRDSIIRECENYKYLTKHDILRDIEDGKFLFLFDAINEIEPTKRDNAEMKLREFRQSYDRNYFAFTSRGSSELSFIGNLEKTELQEFTADDVDQYIENNKCLTQESKAKLKELSRTTSIGVEGNPFFLSLIIEDIKSNPGMDITAGRFKNRGKLFDRIVFGRYMKKSDMRGSSEFEYTTKENKLIGHFKRFMPGFAAWLFMEKQKSSFTENDVKEYGEHLVKMIGTHSLYKTPNGKNRKIDNVENAVTTFIECLDYPDVIPLLEKVSTKHWGFIHDRFFDYFAALHLKDEFLNIVSDTGMQPMPVLADYLQEYINKKRWEDIVLCTVALLVDCEVEKNNIACKCDQRGFFCTQPPEDDHSCQRFSYIKDTYPLSRKR